MDVISNLHIPIKNMKQTTKITGHYEVSCRKHIKEIEKEIDEKYKELKSEKARLKRLGVRKLAFAKGVKVLEKMKEVEDAELGGR